MNTDAIKSRCTGDEFVPVTFEFTHPTAKSVFVAGSFNDWNPKSIALKRKYGGRWMNVSSLRPGDYEYRLIVDGEWILDPQNQVSVENPYGSRNSLMTVSRTEEASHRVNAVQVPLESQLIAS